METWKFACKRARQDSTPGFDCCFFAAQHEQFLAGVGCLQVKTLSKPPNYQPIPCYSPIKTCVRTILIKTVSEKNCVRNVKYSYSNELFPDFSDIRIGLEFLPCKMALSLDCGAVVGDGAGAVSSAKYSKDRNPNEQRQNDAYKPFKRVIITVESYYFDKITLPFSSLPLSLSFYFFPAHFFNVRIIFDRVR